MKKADTKPFQDAVAVLPQTWHFATLYELIPHISIYPHSLRITLQCRATEDLRLHYGAF